MTVMLYEEGYCLRNAEEMQTPETSAPSGRLREEIPPEEGKIVRVVNGSSEFCNRRVQLGETSRRADIQPIDPPMAKLECTQQTRRWSPIHHPTGNDVLRGAQYNLSYINPQSNKATDAYRLAFVIEFEPPNSPLAMSRPFPAPHPR